MRKKDKMQTLGSALQALVKSLGIEKQVEQYKIFDVWNEAVGEQVAKVAQPERIHNGILIVKVDFFQFGHRAPDLHTVEVVIERPIGFKVP